MPVTFTVVALHATIFVVAPLLSTRILSLGPAAIMAGMPLAVLAYGMRNAVQEHSGPAVARSMVASAIAVRALLWPGLFFAGFEDAFRIALAGELQLLVGQYVVAGEVFGWLRARTRWFASRHIITSAVANTVSLAVYVVAANLGTPRPILSVIAGGLILRLVMSALLTPPLAVLARRLEVRP